MQANHTFDSSAFHAFHLYSMSSPSGIRFYEVVGRMSDSICRTSNWACIYTSHEAPNHAITNLGRVCNHDTKKPAPEYLTAGAGIGDGAYSDRGKRIGPVFSSVEKGQDYLSRR